MSYIEKNRTPAPLRRGDTIAIIAPATEVKRQYVEGAASFLRGRGYEVAVSPHCLDNVSGTYSATSGERLDDFLAAYGDERVKCILCARGGYGCVQLIGKIPGALLEGTPKWVVGFSDVSALHALMLSHGIPSLHAGMAKHLAESPEGDFSVGTFLDILEGATEVTYRTTEQDSIITLNDGSATGVLRGGNFAVLNGLASTPFDILHIKEDEDVILFLEDIGEGIYEVDRMLWRLHLSGDLHRAKGLIFCTFNNYRPDKNHSTMEEMIEMRMREWGMEIPVVLNYPVGHIDGRNLPLIEGCRAELTVSPGCVTLRQRLG